ncbi:MAG TPA: circularly permuted type 2 ATP-grasp protein, partial [Burkholderiaceae bacterium]|nr:circularly permuted type 2 ATP-grasp protein [Burkholderiaceae bacterium]
MHKAFDEMYDGNDRVRAHYREFERWLSEQTPDAMQFKRAEADLVFRRVGVTFAIYGDKDDQDGENGEATERLIPFDVVPRIIPAAEWKQLEAGLRQRVRALNMFLRDVYHEQDMLR